MAGVVDDAAVQAAVTEARKRRIVHGSGSRKRRGMDSDAKLLGFGIGIGFGFGMQGFW